MALRKKKKPAADAGDVFGALLHAIVSGRYAAGTRLPAERELAGTMGASRATLREALRRLEEWGLIAPRRGSGILVRDVGKDATVDVLPAYVKSGIGGPEFYRAAFDTIAQVEQSYPQGLELQSLASLDASTLSARALQDSAQGEAYRYALVGLNAFALVGADYDPLNAHGELDLYDAATGHGALTLEYLTDRPELLAAMLDANVADVQPAV